MSWFGDKEKLICPDCGSEDFERVENIEGDDADGNRGQKVIYMICTKCGWY